jgi:HlyD family secretion protein
MKTKLILLAGALALFGCGDDSANRVPTETIAARNWTEILDVDGVIKSAASTTLNVPGSGWENRTLLTMVGDGTMVKKGDVIARFDAPRSRMELSQAETELLRKELSELTLKDKDAVHRAELAADKAKVTSDLTLSERFAGIKAETGILTRNEILDALQDTNFLNDKRGYLDWKKGQLAVRTAAATAVLSAQKDSVNLNATQRRKSLEAMELIAPHDGVFLLQEKWDGTKPQLGASMWSGQEFGKLPDVSALVATFSVAEGEAFGLKTGQAIKARLAGSGAEFELVVSKVGSNASTKSTDSPVKYSEFEATIAPATAGRLALRPGQGVHATVSLVNRPATLTIPNLALIQEGANFAAFVGDKAPGVKHMVVLGQRGPVRSEVKSGLPAGAQVLLLPATGKDGKDKKDKKDGKDQKETKQA